MSPLEFQRSQQSRHESGLAIRRFDVTLIDQYWCSNRCWKQNHSTLNVIRYWWDLKVTEQKS